jgi:hypothetical protein
VSDEEQSTTEPAGEPGPTRQIDVETRLDGDMRHALAGALTREQNIRVQATAIAASRITGFGSVEEVLEMAPRIEAYIRDGAEPLPPLPADGPTPTPTA